MRFISTYNYAAILFFFIFLLCQQGVTGQTNVVTQHNNLDRTGWDNTETILNTKNVHSVSFGKLYTRAVDDQLYAQLLVMNKVTVPGKGIKNLLFAATVNNSVYAFDADSVNITTPYWQVNLTAVGLRPVKNTDATGACGGGYKDFSGNMGIVGTPVIDSVTNTLYVVARSVAANVTGFVQYLHALDITTGLEKANSPILIAAQVAGAGSGSVGGVITFNPQRQNQRCGLLLLNGVVYITYASHCDWGPYHGWILGYDKTSLQQTRVYNTTPDGFNGGIWMSGAAPAADNAGNIYVSTGNGTMGNNGNTSDTRDRSESAIKLIPSGTGFTIPTFFTPSNYTTLENGDLDFGSIEMMLIPNTNQVMTGCKDGNIYVMDRDNMGGYNSSANNVVQTINLGTNAKLHSSFAYYKGTQTEYVYSWSENTLLKAFPYSRTLNKLDVANVINSGVQGPVGNSGAFLTVSSNGSVDSTAILWTSFAANGDANQSVRPGILHAFNANDVTKELWNSSQVVGDDPGNYAKFNCPTVANGKVYLPTFSNQIIVYGLTGTTVDTCNSPNIALNKPAVASSVQNSTYTAAAAFDGNPSTRWASAQQVDPQYIYVDLGARYDLCRVVLQWEAALGKNFTIAVSDDAVNWTTIVTKTNNLSVSNFFSIKGSGRYVRMYGTARGTTYGYSLYSFEVYGTLVASDCPVPGGLSTSDIYENNATIHWQANGKTKFNVQYKAVTSSNWITAAADTNMLVINGLACGTDYLYKVQTVCSTTDVSNYSAATSFSELPCGSNCNPLPTRWTTLDVGNTLISGSACYTPDVFTLKGSGDDIGNTSDAFRFAFKTIVGDGEFNARVATMDQSSAMNKCGIMIRESLSSGSKYTFLGLTSGTGAILQNRIVTDGNSSATSSPTGIAPPYWIKLAKIGSVYSASISPDGFNWTPLGSTLDAGFGNGVPVYAGLAIVSHNNTILSTATVSNYSFSGGALPVKLSSFNAALNLSHKVDLKWTTTLEMNTSYFIVERSATGNRFEAIDTVKAVNNGSFTRVYHSIDNYPTLGNNYYRLKIVDVDGYASYSALAFVRVNNLKSPSIFPNPAKAFVNVTKGSDEVKFITIYDITGKPLIRVNNASGNTTAQIPTTNLLRGTYIIEITTSTSIFRDKLLIQ